MTNLHKNVLATIHSVGANYKVIYHVPVFTTAEVEKILCHSKDEEIKTLALTTSDNINIIITLMSNQRLNLSTLKVVIDKKKLKFTDINRLNSKLGVESGGLSPFGYSCHLNTRVFVSKAVLSLKEVYINPGKNDETIVLSQEDFIQILHKENIVILDDEIFE